MSGVYCIHVTLLVNEEVDLAAATDRRIGNDLVHQINHLQASGPTGMFRSLTAATQNSVFTVSKPTPQDCQCWLPPWGPKLFKLLITTQR